MKSQKELLASLHVTVIRLHDYFNSLGSFIADLIATQRADPDSYSPDQLEMLLTQYLATRCDPTIRDHAVFTLPDQPAELIPLLDKILTTYHGYLNELPKDEQPRPRKAGLQ